MLPIILGASGGNVSATRSHHAYSVKRGHGPDAPEEKITHQDLRVRGSQERGWYYLFSPFPKAVTPQG
jgi:hypothetical protein